MKRIILLIVVLFSATFLSSAVLANTDPPVRGKVSGKSAVAGVLSFLVWPGIGQAVNDQKGSKVLTHVLIGILPPYRFWSGYDALFDRDGGYWDGKI